MIILITGGSGSGKSEYAENLAIKLNSKDTLTYIATMYPYGEETLQKIERHKEMRKDKGFETIECFYGLKELNPPIQSTVLLECMSNLLANELYMPEGAKTNAFDEIMKGVKKLASESQNLLIISNEVFSDSKELDKEMNGYIELLGRINQEIAKIADVVCEVVYSIPILQKGELE